MKMTMHIIVNLISLARIPLALVFLQDSIFLRVLGIVLAMITDFLDGFLARRYNVTSQFGATLDPLMDKLFVFFALGVFYMEDRITVPEMGAMMCRDFSVMFFGIYLILRGTWTKYQFRSIWCGKITTALQLVVLIGLTLQLQLPEFVFTSFIILGALALVELYFSHLQSQAARD